MCKLILCFSGADGSGKSTLARLTARYFREKGFRVGFTWLRGTHTLASIIARILGRFKVFKGSCNPYYYICIPERMRWLWAFIELASITPVYLWRFKLKKLHADILIAERGILDFLVWLTATLRWPSAVRSLPGKITLALAVSSCSKLIYVRADRSILLERRRGWRDEALIPFELVIYDTLASILKTPVVDTSRASISESLREVLRVVGEVQ